ncbi:hypothetical protein J6590_072009 [Homalodisca vitripennis]|nr:hypothetical protein J6590_072009 [Homalodisca vitripennis]
MDVNSTLTATLVPQIFLYSYRNFTKFDSGRVEGTKVMLDSLDKKEKEQNRASLKRIIDTTIFCGENEIPLRGHWATDGRKPFRKGGQFSSVARVQIKLTVGKCTGKTLLIKNKSNDNSPFFSCSMLYFLICLKISGGGPDPWTPPFATPLGSCKVTGASRAFKFQTALEKWRRITHRSCREGLGRPDQRN